MNNEQLSLDLELDSVYSNLHNTFYETYNDLPNNYKDYIKNNVYFSDSRVIYDLETGDVYCPNCFSLLLNDTCNNCGIDFNNKKSIFTNIINKKIIDYNLRFLIIESNPQNVFAYVIDYNITYDKEKKYKKTVPDLFNAFLIRENGIYDLSNKRWMSYPDIHSIEDGFYIDTSTDEMLELTSFINSDIDYIYPYNLDSLASNELYKYIDINKYKILINKPYNKTIITLLIKPIIYPEYEYLLKMELYQLICYGINYLGEGNSFNDIFGFSKKYYSFIKEIDIGPSELFALRMYNTDNPDILRFISRMIRRYDYRKKENIEWIFTTFKNDMVKLYNYINNNEIEIYDYLDYISWNKEMNVDLKSNKIKYPENFYLEHDKLYKEKAISEDSEINDKLKRIHNSLIVNSFEDDKYVIRPCYDIDSLLDESNQMHNCVRTYIDRIINHECEIYFMRDKNNISESLVTVEVKDGKVVQARRKYNKDITKEEERFLKKFENNYKYL